MREIRKVGAENIANLERLAATDPVLFEKLHLQLGGNELDPEGINTQNTKDFDNEEDEIYKIKLKIKKDALGNEQKIPKNKILGLSNDELMNAVLQSRVSKENLYTILQSLEKNNENPEQTVFIDMLHGLAGAIEDNIEHQAMADFAEQKKLSLSNAS